MRYEIAEIQGAPRAIMEIPVLLPDGSLFVERIRYQSVRIGGFTTADQVEKFWNEKFEALKKRLLEFAASAGHDAIVWWRIKPEFSYDQDRHSWCVYTRLETSPRLPAEWWTSWLDLSHMVMGEGMPFPTGVAVNG